MSQESETKTDRFSPFGRHIGLTFSRVEDGFSRVVLEPQESLRNSQGLVHGGVIYTMADMGMGAALYSRLEAGQRLTTVEINIVYFAPVVSGPLSCEARVVHQGRRVAVLEAEVKNEERLVARATGTYYVLTSGPEAGP